MIDTRRQIITAIFIALAVAGGLALVQFPNVELITATSFLAGMTLGKKRGLFVGAAAEFLYSTFNPYGAALPPLLVTQVICMAIVGYAGGMLSNLIRRSSPVWSAVILGAAGFVLTLIFDLMTTLAVGFTIGQTLMGFLTALLAGLSFYLTHLITNTLIFSTLLPIILQRLKASHVLPTNN